MPTTEDPGFSDLSLRPELLKAIRDIGYEAPSPIQAAAIPPLLEGRDLLGQAQTGTGKTGAFALPLLSRLDLRVKQPQVLVLTPTRELAIQVAEATQGYARHLKGFHVLPIYGGQSIDVQLRKLQRGVHFVVGTPGRIQDHLRRKTLGFDRLFSVVLDEADEMLRMGFIDEVKEILSQTPAEKQVALFSATMPAVIRRVAREHLRDPVEIKIKSATATVASVTQRYWMTQHSHKLSALTSILEVEDFDAMLVFVRTRSATVELSEKLEARGFASAPLSGEMTQPMRERTVERLKRGKLDIVVATDVAARGLHVDRISHVINYDVPYDAEAYVHRIGRTARGGKEGQAIIFVSPREQRMLRAIERATRQPIERMRLPTRRDIADRRIEQFKQRLGTTIKEQGLSALRDIVDSFQAESDSGWDEIAAALAYLVQRERPFLPYLAEEKTPPPPPSPPARDFAPPTRTPSKARRETRVGSFARYRLEIGRCHGVQPGNIVGAIVNEGGIERGGIGAIDIQEDHTVLELPVGLSQNVLKRFRGIWVCSRRLTMTPLTASGERAPRRPTSAAQRAKTAKRRQAKPAKPGRKKVQRKKHRKG